MKNCSLPRTLSIAHVMPEVKVCAYTVVNYEELAPQNKVQKLSSLSDEGLKQKSAILNYSFCQTLLPDNTIKKLSLT